MIGQPVVNNHFKSTLNYLKKAVLKNPLLLLKVKNEQLITFETKNALLVNEIDQSYECRCVESTLNSLV
jgi:hypothetical protein